MLIIMSVRDFSIHETKKNRQYVYYSADGRCIGTSLMGLELHPITAEGIVGIGPSCCMCYLFLSASPGREE